MTTYITLCYLNKINNLEDVSENLHNVTSLNYKSLVS